MKLLPNVRVVVLLGKAAADAWELVGVDLPAIRAPHPSPKNLNSHPRSREMILRALRDARARAGYARTERAPSTPGPPSPTYARAGRAPRRSSPAVSGSAAPSEIGREAIRDALRAGLTPDQIFARNGRRRSVYLLAIEEEARLEGEHDAFAATPDNAARLRDQRELRWERIAVRLFGDPRRMTAVRDLYDAAKGVGASKRSYTGRGRRFPDME